MDTPAIADLPDDLDRLVERRRRRADEEVDGDTSAVATFPHTEGRGWAKAEQEGAR